MKFLFMKKKLCVFIWLAMLLYPALDTFAWQGMAMPRLHVNGRYFKDGQGNIVNLHGFAQTYSPWFNERGTKWNNYDVNGCLTYNQGLIDKIMAAGWKMNFVRLHMDPYWSNTPGLPTTGENDISAFSMDRFKTYLQSVFIPIAKYAISKGLYVIMRPPGVCPGTITVGDAYNQYLLKVWSWVSADPYIKNHPNIMFELANEPITITNADGSAAGFKELNQFFQSVTNTIRKNCNNIVLVPGLGWQGNFTGFADYPIKGENIGYAVHCYPGWMNSGSEDTPNVTYQPFKDGWNRQIKPVSDFAPIVVTEMDWAPQVYNASWGKGITGTAGGVGFGANFNKIADESGNVSYLIFTTPELLAQYDDKAADGSTFLTDPEACPRAAYRWYQEYATRDYPHPEFAYQSMADQGNGTYKNPIIKADFPDPDVVRVGDTYYMVTTTMHHFPGCTLLKSKDLVNWEYCANPLAKMSSNPEYNLENGMNIYSKGSWANSLMYKNGKFYIMFNAFGRGDDGGGYLLSASDPEGTWTMKRLARGYYDPGMMTDDNGTTYVACGNTNISVVQLDDDFNLVNEVVVIKDHPGVEGSHMFKKDGYYYIYAVNSGWPGKQMCFRSRNPFGPYEEKLVFDYNAIHQGAMIQVQSGEWWTILMQDNGAFGRMPCLEPVQWVDNWPVIGVDGKDATATMVYHKPNVNATWAPKALPTNDNFRNYILGKQWQWNHNPDNSKWSLLENPGHLRLYTATITDSLQNARNTLTQRIFGYYDNTKKSYGTIRLDVSHMQTGDMTGLAVFQEPYAFIGVKKIQDKQYELSVQSNSSSFASMKKTITCDSFIYLRAIADMPTSTAQFYYSLDNTQSYTQYGSILNMKYDLKIFVGNRFFIFNYATQSLGGYVDVDWFSTEPTFDESTYYDNRFTAYSESNLTASSLASDKNEYALITGSSKSFSLTAIFSDGHSQDVTTDATYEVSNAGVVSIKSGRLVPGADGTSTVTATYLDPLGNVKTTTFTVSVSLFPLKNDAINTNVFGNGTFDETTRELTTSQYGFGGWWYDNGVDLSAYKYIIVKLKKLPTCDPEFRLFDEHNYWSNCSTTKLTSLANVIELSKLLKGSTTTFINLSHIYLMGFWSYGGSPISIDDIYVSNDGITSALINDVFQARDGGDKVDVFDLNGIKVLHQVPFQEIKQRLHKGVYIVDGKKIVIQ